MNKPKVQKKPIKFDSYEALLGLENIDEDTSGHSVQSNYPVLEINLDELKEFPEHPFKVLDDEQMKELVESISEYGLFHPGLAIKDPEGGYFIVSGHRRARASRMAGKDVMPFRILDTDMETARIMMVDSNFQQRDELLPSEKAKAYRQKYDAIKRQGKRGLGSSFDEVGEAAGESGRTVQRFIRLSYLSDELLELVDAGKLGVVQGVDISFLDDEKQSVVCDAIIQTGISMSKEQAAKIKEYGTKGNLIPEMVMLILTDKKPKKRQFSLKADKLSEYFSEDVSEDEIEQVILELLDNWKKGR